MNEAFRGGYIVIEFSPPHCLRGPGAASLTQVLEKLHLSTSTLETSAHFFQNVHFGKIQIVNASVDKPRSCLSVSQRRVWKFKSFLCISSSLYVTSFTFHKPQVPFFFLA